MQWACELRHRVRDGTVDAFAGLLLRNLHEVTIRRIYSDQNGFLNIVTKMKFLNSKPVSFEASQLPLA